jgi:hypothetical protein
MKSPFSAPILLALVALSGGCGSRTDLDFLSGLGAPNEPDSGTRISYDPDAGTNVVVLPGDAGIEILPDGAVVVLTDAANAPPTPHCILTSTCSEEYVAPGYGWTAGTFPVETVSAACKIPPSVVQQAMSGTWVTLEGYRSQASDQGNLDPGAYDISTPSSVARQDPPIGGTPGSVEAIRACLYPPSGEVDCDPPTFIAISNCGTCPNHKNCGVGKFLDDNCQCATTPPPIVISQ